MTSHRSYVTQLREGIGPTGTVTWANRIYTNTWLTNNAEAICDLIETASDLLDDMDGSAVVLDETPLRSAVTALRGK